jgi:hypothetical protein
MVFLALCLRLVVAITNYERGDNPGSTIISVWELFYDILVIRRWCSDKLVPCECEGVEPVVGGRWIDLRWDSGAGRTGTRVFIKGFHISP